MDNKMSTPMLYKRKEDCCGCTACYAICPKEAIIMKEDEEGFEYPHIDESKCVSCGMCLNVCPIKAVEEECRTLLRNKASICLLHFTLFLLGL